MAVDPLVKVFIATARELDRRKFWRAIREDEVPIVVLRATPQPIAIVVTEGDGRQGLTVTAFRGARAFRLIAGIFTATSSQGLPLDAVDLLGCTLKPWRDVSPDGRRFFKAHGVAKPEKGELLPDTLSKPAFSEAAPPDRAELTALVLILQGLLRAFDRGELPMERGVFASGRTLEIEVGGDPAEPEVRTSLVPWPEPDAGLDPRFFPAHLAKLERLDERWGLVAVATGGPGPSEIHHDRVVAHVFPLGGGESIKTLAVNRDSVMDLARAVGHAFLGDRPGGTVGLPSEIAFQDEVLHRELRDALAALDVPTVYAPDDPELVARVAELEAIRAEEDVLEDDDEWEDEDGEDVDLSVTPRTREDWHAASRAVGRMLIDAAEARGTSTKRTWKRFFGPEITEDDASEHMVMDCYLQWLFADHRTSRNAPTLIETLLREEDLPPVARTLLEARRDAVLSIFRIAGKPTPGAVELEDLVHGTRHVYHDEDVAAAAEEGWVLALRRAEVEGHTLVYPASPAFADMDLDAFLEMMEDVGYSRSSAGTRKDAHLFGRLWED